ncbi:MAG: UbiA family prenyltransferase [Chitinispirillales bacterium]|jgi:geranylgeranylglycerol-phosphate geranylgeranyltransferase|nr:UbiA family prenyltransferase [Chitinispirillales bacterium]
MVKVVKVIVPYIRTARPLNTAIVGCAVFLGMWLAGFPAPVPVYVESVEPVAGAVKSYTDAILLILAAMAATAYGNAVNDILDVETDRVSHPDRPLVTGAMSIGSASVFTAALATLSLACATAVSVFHATAALIPIILLTMYSIYFKRTKLIGNIIVAALTAYALLFGGLSHPDIKILFAPALLAFLLNFCRELAKDVQDTEGDRAAGFATSAELPRPIIGRLLIIAGCAHLAAMWAPSLLLGHFGMVYTGVCVAAVLPLHISWMMLAFRADFDKYVKRMGAILKAEMVAGLAALAADKIIWTL